MLAAFDYWILSFSAITVLATLGMGYWAAQKARTASDFFVAGRGVSVGWNASAISGEYLSAASFMGVAGMVMSSGYDALWYPVCYACGYLFLLLFIAGPLRRFGAYTIPDFAEGRYDSPVFRKIAVIFVLFIGFFYTMPQMKGAGTTLAYIFPGMPYWGGVVLVGAVITLNVALGGMKGITLVQAFQYWAKMFAISVPIFVLMSVYGSYGAHVGVNDGRSGMASPPVAVAGAPSAGATTPSAVATTPDGDVVRKPLSSKAPADQAWVSPFGPLTTKAAKAAGLTDEQAKPYSLLYTYSLIIALVCGTAGLPHILVRFYTNPDGVAAKRTTMWVMILIGIFYVFPPIFGVIGRNLLPELYNATGAKGTDKIVLELPRLLNERGGIWGSILSGITCAGAFAAFMQAFAIAAASYFPLLFMSVWWRGMTMAGAATGMLGGGLAALACTTVINLSDLKKIDLAGFWATHPLLRILCEQPAIWTVPLAIGLMIVVSKATRAQVPGDIRMKMLVLHAPEKLGLKQEYIQEHQAGAGH